MFNVKQFDENNIVEYNRNIRHKNNTKTIDDTINSSDGVERSTSDLPEDDCKKIDKNTYFMEVAMEILRKSDIKGSTEKMVREYIRTYNALKTQLSDTSNIQIPKQTVFYDYIICLEDGKKMQMLQRHLKVKYNMTFQDYKQKWGLRPDYPHTCPKYSEIRAEIVKKKRKTQKNVEKRKNKKLN